MEFIDATIRCLKNTPTSRGSPSHKMNKLLLSSFAVILALSQATFLAAESPESPLYTKEYRTEVDTLFKFLESGSGKKSRVNEKDTKKSYQATQDFNTWLKRILDKDFLPPANSEYKFFRRGTLDRDIIIQEWRVDNISFSSAQTADIFILRINSDTPSLLFPDRLVSREASFFDEQANQIVYFRFRDYIKYIIGNPSKKLDTERGNEKFLANDIGIVAFAKMTKSMNPELKPLEDEVTWHRNISVWQSSRGWTIGFPKTHFSQAVSPSIMAIEKDWF